MFSKEAPARLFLSFLVLVLVLVNAQSLQLSSHSRELLTASFEEAFELRARVLADELSSAGEGREASVATELLAERAPAHRFRSACVLDWDGRLLTGGSCDPARGEAFDRLDHQQKRRLVEEGWAMAAISSPYEVEKAEASGYVALRRDSDGEGSYAVLRVVMPAPSIAEANRRFRATLIYQVSGLSLVLLAILLFFHSLVAPHRRLVAEARSVATELSPDGGAPVNDEAQFLLETFQEVVARLKQKEQELLALHRLEKTRADETEALASDIIRSMTTGLVSLDPSGHVVVVNPAAERIFGIDTSNARGRLFHEVFPGSEELGRMVDEALLRGAYQLRGQTRYGLGEGRILHLGVSVIPLLSPQETPKGALCLVADLTEVVELRERVFLKENLARLGETAAGIAHEFRNGLATILGNARLLKGSNPSSEPIVEALVAESQSLARIVSELLQFARPEPLRLETFDLKALVYELLEELRPRAAAAGVLLSLEGDAVGLDADETLIRKALSNLVVNALEALEEIEESGRVDVEVREASGLALVRVRDNGPGIDAPHRAKIFTPFFTLKEKGTGLGLSVVQKIVVTHNGTVELEETPSGASFVVKLPLRGPASFESEDWL